jgi:hypothetical protein
MERFVAVGDSADKFRGESGFPIESPYTESTTISLWGVLTSSLSVTQCCVVRFLPTLGES